MNVDASKLLAMHVLRCLKIGVIGSMLAQNCNLVRNGQ
jgi:hypothetical protein